PDFSSAASSGCVRCSLRAPVCAMTSDPSEPSDRERRRNEVLAACLEDPVLAAEVMAFLADHGRIDRLARPLRPARDDVPTMMHPPPGDPRTVAAPPESTPARCFGDYELLVEIARGGM